MKTRLTLLAIVLIAVVSFAFISIEKTNESEEAVKALVTKAYINGAFNKLDAESMENGFHPDFAIYSPKGTEISKYPIADWVAGVKKRRDDNYDPNAEKNKWDHKFAAVDVTGHAAQVKVQLYNQGKHVFTDYLSLLRFEDDWKIVAKVYYRHK